MAPVQPRKRPDLRNRARPSTSKPSTSSSSASQRRSVPQNSTPYATSSSISSFPSQLSSTSWNSGTEGSLFANTKKDKQTIRSSAFKSRIEKAHAKPNKKRRRPSKKLIATLQSLADVLPDAVGDNAVSERRDGATMAKVEGPEVRGGSGAIVKIQQRSMKSRPGTMKMRQVLEKRERERFEKNMATIIGSRPNHERDNTSYTNGANGRGSIRLAENQVEEATMNIEDGVTEATVRANSQAETRQVTSTTAARWAALRSFIRQTLEQKEDIKTQ